MYTHTSETQTCTKEMSNTLTLNCPHYGSYTHTCTPTCRGNAEQTTDMTYDHHLGNLTRPIRNLNSTYVSCVAQVSVCERESTWCPCNVYRSLPSTRSRIFIVESLDAVIRKLPAGWKDKPFTTPLWTGTHTHTKRKSLQQDTNRCTIKVCMSSVLNCFEYRSFTGDREQKLNTFSKEKLLK